MTKQSNLHANIALYQWCIIKKIKNKTSCQYVPVFILADCLQIPKNSHNNVKLHHKKAITSTFLEFKTTF